MIGKNILSEEKRVWFIFGSEITRKKKKKKDPIFTPSWFSIPKQITLPEIPEAIRSIWKDPKRFSHASLL